MTLRRAWRAPRRPSDGFASLGLAPALLETLSALGWEPTPIQREAIPPLLAGRDLIGQAATGTGKTAAFALPILERLRSLGAQRPKPAALILVPTRELAMQVAEAVHRYGRWLPASVVPITAVKPTDRSSVRSNVVSTWSSQHRDERSITCGAERSCSESWRWSCSTKPTRCSTWASPTTSRRSWPRPR
jgi:ATP-dependent helicase YprA (DUF1998 family)